MSLSDEHQRYIRKETLIGCVINALFGLAFAFLYFHDVPLIPLWGAGGIAVDLVPTIFMLTLMGNLAVTLITRKRLRQGDLAPLDADALGWKRRLPGNAFLRVLTVAVAMTVSAWPLSVAGLLLFSLSSMQFWPFVLFKMIYGAFISALSAPIILTAALADSGTARKIKT
jgi:hypothetical protein